MTTNVIDFQKLVIACDSRCSKDWGDYVIYVDDTGFDKIAVNGSLCAIFAGNLKLIDGWKNWIGTPSSQPLGLFPATAGVDPQTNSRVAMQVCLIDRERREARFYGMSYQALASHFFFGGTGAPFAMQCFRQNFCGKKAIGTASLSDVYTGGSTIFFELETAVNNLSPKQVTVDELEAQFPERGIVMHKPTKNVTTLKEFLQKPEAAPLLAGTFSLSAPSGGVQRDWTAAEREDAERFARSIIERDRQKKGDSAND